MYETVKKWCVSQALFKRGDPVVAACSGGVDSLVLTDLLQALADETGLRLAVAHVDHGIRGADARADAAFVEAFCAARGLPFYLERADVPAYAKMHALSVEDAARTVRYAFLRALSARLGGAKIATGHHRGDQAETVLLHLLRGAGSGGLGAMRAASAGVVRPLLCVSRAEIETYAAARGFCPRVDATNFETYYTRNRVRLDIMPLLCSVNPSAELALCRSAALLRDEHDYIRAEAEKAVECCMEPCAAGFSFDRNGFNALHIAVRREVLRLAAERLVGRQNGIGFEHVERALILAKTGNTGRTVQFPGNIVFQTTYHALYIGPPNDPYAPYEPLSADVGDFEARLRVPGITRIAPLGIVFRAEILPACEKPPGRDTVVFDMERLQMPLVARRRRSGDRFYPGGMSGGKKLKDFFIDEKIDRKERDRIPILCDQTAILWVAGIRQGQTGRVTRETRRFLRLTIERETNEGAANDMINDLERVSYTKEEIAICVARMGKEISRDYAGKEIVAIAVLKGAIVFYADLIRAIEIPVQMDFMAVSSYGKSTNSSGTVKVLKDLDYNVEGKHILIVEDIVDSGLTLNYLIQSLMARKPASIKLCTMLNKPERRKVEVKIDYCGFSVPDDFLVGYGLDYAEKYRNLPCIGILKRAIYE